MGQSTTHITQYKDFKTVAKCHIRWMKRRFIICFFSVLIIMASFFSFFHKQFNLGIDFSGGILIEAGFKQRPDVVEIRSLLKEHNLLSGPVQYFGEKEVIIQMGARNDSSLDPIVKETKALLVKKYKDQIHFRRVETVGSKVGDELIDTSLNAIVIAIIAMLFYIWLRFEWPFAVGSIVALMHDIIITLGIFSFFQIELGLPIVAAILTIIGYSMNDTVVTFDRIRENLTLYRKAHLEDLIDLSINETLARTFVTSITTLISLTILFIYGGSVIQPFIIAMIIGVLVGTYSSVFIATTTLLFLGVKNNFKSLSSKKHKKIKENIIL